MDGGQGETVTFWDPQASTKKKWKETYAAELQNRGLTQDFTGLSTLLLGQAQPAQFQTEGQTGYWWGSKVSDDGNWTALDAVTNNANVEMPRSYYHGNDAFGAYYNWYGATAESGHYSTARTSVDDSLCPKGWRLAGDQAGKSQDVKSWRELYLRYNAGGNFANAEMKQILSSLPISQFLAGYVNFTHGRLEHVGNSFGSWASFIDNGLLGDSVLHKRSSFPGNVLLV